MFSGNFVVRDQLVYLDYHPVKTEKKRSENASNLGSLWTPGAGCPVDKECRSALDKEAKKKWEEVKEYYFL